MPVNDQRDQPASSKEHKRDEPIRHRRQTSSHGNVVGLPVIRSGWNIPAKELLSEICYPNRKEAQERETEHE